MEEIKLQIDLKRIKNDVDYTKNGFPIEITIKNEGSKGTQPVNFPFSIVTKGSHTYTLTPDGGTGSNIPPLDGVSSGTNFININGANSTKKYTLNSSDCIFYSRSIEQGEMTSAIMLPLKPPQSLRIFV